MKRQTRFKMILLVCLHTRTDAIMASKEVGAPWILLLPSDVRTAGEVSVRLSKGVGMQKKFQSIRRVSTDEITSGKASAMLPDGVDVQERFQSFRCVSTDMRTSGKASVRLSDGGGLQERL